MSEHPYTPDYFIEKFTAIPARKWCTERYSILDHNGIRKCATRHCSLGEAMVLDNLFARCGLCVISVNDKPYRNRKTPRGRILAALRWIKKKEPKP